MFGIDLSDRNVWVTGGSRGIGRSTAIAMAKAGAKVAISFRSGESQANEVAQEVASLGAEAMIAQLDVTDPKSCEEAFGRIKKQFGQVDVIVNSAGVTADNLFMMLESEEWAKVINTNLMGVVNVTKAAVKDLMMQRWGRVINLSSVAGTKAGRGQSNYAASKGAVEAMSRSLAVELAKRNITVNCIAPGVIETEMSAEVRKLAHEEIMNRQLVKRYGKPEEVAAWAVFLASEFGEYMTGQTIHIDGGLKMP